MSQWIGRPRAGFTLAELLVVMSIIAFLVATMLAVVGQTRAKSRDARREADLKTLQSALVIYVVDHGVYPVAAGSGVCLDGTDAVSSALRAAGAITVVPRDPRHNCTTAEHYHYTSEDGSTYQIVYALETDSIPGKNAGVQPPVGP